MSGDNIAAAKAMDLLALIEPTTTLKKVAAHEYAGPCPKCGGHDRFHVDPARGWFCRTCTGAEHWNDQIDFVMFWQGCDFRSALLRLVGRADITPEELERRAEERRQRDAERRRMDAEKEQATAAKLEVCPDWLTYHNNLVEYPEAISYWADRGIPWEWQEYFKLGYCPSRTFTHGEETFTAASLTIPYWRCKFVHYPGEPGGWEWHIINLKHRILGTDAPGGKYRPHLAGAGNHVFYTNPAIGKFGADLLIVEGEIKAMVTEALCWSGEDCLAPFLDVVGVPGKNFKPEWIPTFQDARRVFVCLDPDAERDAERLAGLIGPHAKTIKLPGKIDDLILAGILDFKMLAELMS